MHKPVGRSRLALLVHEFAAVKPVPVNPETQAGLILDAEIIPGQSLAVLLQIGTSWKEPACPPRSRVRCRKARPGKSRNASRPHPRRGNNPGSEPGRSASTIPWRCVQDPPLAPPHGSHAAM